MAQLTIVGPNIKSNKYGDFHVHSLGCVEIHRNSNYRWASNQDGDYSSVDEIVEDMFFDQINEATTDEERQELIDSFYSEVHVFDCAQRLLDAERDLQLASN